VGRLVHAQRLRNLLDAARFLTNEIQTRTRGKTNNRQT
jgi:hypothetical protein